MPTGICHTPPVASPAAESPGIAALEAVLARWFDAEVVLTSSGRGALLLWLTQAGLNRYRHRVAAPRMMSACVLDAVIRRAFPVDIETEQTADATVFYHQYGFTQSARPRPGRVLEDICHAFFASHETGARDFAGEAAIFSLPKFFGLRMMAGGVLTRDPSLARDLRARRDAAPEPPSVTARRQARTWLRQGKTGGLDLEALYLERLVNPRLADSELAGAPVTLADIRAVGAARRVTVDRLLAATANLPAEWSAMLGATLPFVFPVFGEPGRLARLDADLAAMGVQAGVYQIDVARNCYAPAYRPAVLLPCHHQIGARLAKVISLLHASS